MSNITDDYFYELPGADVKLDDILFNLPQQYTDGLFINFWLFGLYGILFIGSLRFQLGARRASMFAGFGTFITTFLLTLGGWAGANQLLPATIALLLAMAWNYTASGGPRL